MSKKSKERKGRQGSEEFRNESTPGDRVNFAAMRRAEKENQLNQFPFFQLIENELKNRLVGHYQTPFITALPWTIIGHPTEQFIIDKRVSSKSPYFIQIVAHRQPIEPDGPPTRAALPERIELVLLVYSSADAYSISDVNRYAAFQDGEKFKPVSLPTVEQLNAKLSQDGQVQPLRSHLILINTADGQQSINRSFKENFPILEHAPQPVVKNAAVEEIIPEALPSGSATAAAVEEVTTETTALLTPVVTAAALQEPSSPVEQAPFHLTPTEIVFYQQYCSQLQKTFPDADVSPITTKFFFDGALQLTTITLTKKVAGAERAVTLIVLNQRIASGYDNFIAKVAQYLKSQAGLDFTPTQVRDYFISLNAPIAVVHNVKNIPTYLTTVINTAFKGAAKANDTARDISNLEGTIVSPPKVIRETASNPFLLKDTVASKAYLKLLQQQLGDTMTVGQLKKRYFFDGKVCFNTFDVAATTGSNETITVILVPNTFAYNYQKFEIRLAKYLGSHGFQTSQAELTAFFRENDLFVVVTPLSETVHPSVPIRITRILDHKIKGKNAEFSNITPEKQLCEQLRDNFPELEILEAEHRTEFGVRVFAIILKNANGQTYTIMLHDGGSRYRSLSEFVAAAIEKGDYTKTREDFYTYLSINNIYLAIQPFEPLHIFTIDHLRQKMANLLDDDLVHRVGETEREAMGKKEFLNMLTHFGFSIGWEADSNFSEAFAEIELYPGCKAPGIKIHINNAAFQIILVDPQHTNGKLQNEPDLLSWVAEKNQVSSNDLRRHCQKNRVILLSGSFDGLSTVSIEQLLYIRQTFGPTDQ